MFISPLYPVRLFDQKIPPSGEVGWEPRVAYTEIGQLVGTGLKTFP